MAAGADPGIWVVSAWSFHTIHFWPTGYASSSVTRISLRIHHNCGLHSSIGSYPTALSIHSGYQVNLSALSKCNPSYALSLQVSGSFALSAQLPIKGGDRLALQADIAILNVNLARARLPSLPISRRGSRPSCCASVFHAERTYELDCICCFCLCQQP